MPRKKVNGTKHLITVDFILQMYKESKSMAISEQEKIVDKLKDMVKYIGKEITIELPHG